MKATAIAAAMPMTTTLIAQNPTRELREPPGPDAPELAPEMAWAIWLATALGTW